MIKLDLEEALNECAFKNIGKENSIIFMYSNKIS